MAKHRLEGFELEDQRLSFSPSHSLSPQHSYPAGATPLYYVQSPHSTLSHAHTTHQAETPLLSPITTTTAATTSTSTTNNNKHRHQVINSNNFSIPLPSERSTRSDLSRYSSSRGSSSSFLRAKTSYVFSKLESGLRHVGGGNGIGSTGNGGGDDDSINRSKHGVCFVMKIAWKALVSFAVAILVFFLATRPPIPQLYIKDVMVREFRLTEGVDRSGVPTKILRCNCSMNLEVDNRSRVFGVHLHKATLLFTFGNLNLAMSHGPNMYLEKNALLSFRLFIGAKDKAMYAAGQSMYGMLESGMGLPLVLHLTMKSDIRVVWNIVRPRFTHHAHCLVVLHKDHDNVHPKQDLNSTCTSESF